MIEELRQLCSHEGVFYIDDQVKYIKNPPLVILGRFSKTSIDPSWAFLDKSRKDTAYITHGYHRYPAKFIPQIVSRLAKTYSKEKDLMIDPFMGCGTTLIESKVLGRHSVGTDINPVAVLITKVKKTPITPFDLLEEFAALMERLTLYTDDTKLDLPDHERIDYWFKPVQKKKLAFLLKEINKVNDIDIKDFFYCGFSNILKNCSIWDQGSSKPIRDFDKKPADPFVAFNRQIRSMVKGNDSFIKLLKDNGTTDTPCDVKCADARSIPVKDNSVKLVVTSPPYVTSYEYADLHQLTVLWFNYTNNLSDFRQRFIGTAYHSAKPIDLNSEIAENIVNKLQEKHNKTSKEVATYFSEMNQVFTKMYEVIKPNGVISLVVGNTKLKGVEILNAEVFVEQLQNIGFTIEDIIKREIPSKILPSTRDEKTGQFVKSSSSNKVFSYPTEYILVMRKVVH